LKIRVAVDSGEKRAFATAVDWPGWARSAKTREEALELLVEYGTRYKKSVGRASAALTLPTSSADLEVVATVTGDKNADFGVPHATMKTDLEPISEKQLDEQVKFLRACWKAFADAAAAAHGKTLAAGPRGGGRTLAKIVEHVHGADREAYIPTLGGKAPAKTAGRDEVETAFVEALHAKLRGELPERGPRGGERWSARYAIRRSAWHALDHAWEIEDRSS
jgi:hypothetical protein